MRSWALDPRTRHALLAVGLAVGAVAQLGVDGDVGAPLLGWVLLTTLPLALRDRAPVTAGLVVQVVFLVGTPWASQVELLAQGVAVFLVATYVAALGPGSWRGSVLAGLASLALLGTQGAIDPRFDATGAVVANCVYVAMSWGVAAAVRVHAESARRSRRLAEHATRTSRQQARLAVEEERSRLARELHDVLGHSISVMVMRARGGIHDHATDPAVGLEALRDVEAVGARALADVRVLLQLDHGTPAADDPGPDREEGGAEHRPAPGIDDLVELAAQTTRAGLTVELSERGDRRPVSGGLALTAYRVVQESLTNVMRHSHAPSARVVLVWGEQDLRVDVTDAGPSLPGPTGGRGLLGMTDRVRLLGGELSWGEVEGGGFGVRACLPVTSP